jgi:hypothetical protein
MTSELQKKPSALQREHPALQNMKVLNFFLVWVIFALLDPDPNSEYGSGSNDLIESGTNTDLDPKPWLSPSQGWGFLFELIFSLLYVSRQEPGQLTQDCCVV